MITTTTTSCWPRRNCGCDRVVGTCSCCGGLVTVPEVWLGVCPPVPRCQSCGATVAGYYPVVPTVPCVPYVPYVPYTPVAPEPPRVTPVRPSVTWTISHTTTSNRVADGAW